MDVTWNLLKNMADVIPHQGKVVYTVPPCDKDVLSNYIMFVPLPPPSTSELPADSCRLDIYYWTYSTPGSTRTLATCTQMATQTPKIPIHQRHNNYNNNS